MNVLGIIILVAVIIIVWFIVYVFMREENEPTMKYHHCEATCSGYWEVDKSEEKNKKSGVRVFFSSIGVTAIVFVLIFLIGKCTTDLGIGDDEPYVNDAHTYDRY